MFAFELSFGKTTASAGHSLVDGPKVSKGTVFQSFPKGDVSALGWFDEEWMVALGSLSINAMQLRLGNGPVHGSSTFRGGTPSSSDAAHP